MMASAPCASLLRTGTVVDYAPQGIVVEISAQQSCEPCAQGKGCGMGLLVRRQYQRITISLPSGLHRKEQRYPLGCQVTISLPRASVTRLAVYIYALPLLLALCLAGITSQVSELTWLAPLAFFISLLGGAQGIKYLLRERGERFRPRLVS